MGTWQNYIKSTSVVLRKFIGAVFLLFFLKQGLLFI